VRTGLDSTTELLALRGVVTFGLATASYFLVEMPVRHHTWKMPRVRILAPVATALLAVMVFAVTVSGSSAVAHPFRSLERAVANSKHPPPDARLSRSTATPVTAPVARPDLPVMLGGRPGRIYLGGDSVAVSLGDELAAVATGQAAVWNQGRLGCGLAPADLTVGSIPGSNAADCTVARAAWINNSTTWDADVVVLLGEVWDTYDREGPAGTLSFGTPQYDAWYLGQLQWLVDQFAAHHIPVALLTAPCVDGSEFTLGGYNAVWHAFDPQRIPHLNALLSEVARRNPVEVTLLDLNGLVCPAGVPVQTVDGENVRVDGIHFSAAGSQWVSRWLLAQLVTSG
jgi:hypothetical protein